MEITFQRFTTMLVGKSFGFVDIDIELKNTSISAISGNVFTSN